MAMKLLFTFVITFLVTYNVDAFRPPRCNPLARKTVMRVSNSDRNYLYRNEPTELERKVIEEEEHDRKHATFHIERGPEYVDDKSDSAHTIHHHLIDVDHEKLTDLDRRAQKAWLPVEVHEMEVDPVTLAATVFVSIALVLILFGQSDAGGLAGFVARLSNSFKGN